MIFTKENGKKKKQNQKEKKIFVKEIWEIEKCRTRDRLLQNCFFAQKGMGVKIERKGTGGVGSNEGAKDTTNISKG